MLNQASGCWSVRHLLVSSTLVGQFDTFRVDVLQNKSTSLLKPVSLTLLGRIFFFHRKPFFETLAYEGMSLKKGGHGGAKTPKTNDQKLCSSSSPAISLLSNASCRSAHPSPIPSLRARNRARWRAPCPAGAGLVAHPLDSIKVAPERNERQNIGVRSL